MDEIEGMREAFERAKVVFLTTFENGKETSRPMTNFNDDPYEMMWFPTDKKSRKVKDIEGNHEVLITFPSDKKGEYYEIKGRAEFEDEKVTAGKWKWWYLYWHPTQRKRFWFAGVDSEWEKMIINVYPDSARLAKKG